MNEMIAAGTLGVVLVGGVYMMLPNWENVSGDATEDVVTSILVAPINIAGKFGSRLGAGIMKAAGYTYTAAELKELQPILLANATIPGTPENAAKQLYEMMQVPGQKEQFMELQVNLLGSDAEWNVLVANSYLPMYYADLHDSIRNYMR